MNVSYKEVVNISVGLTSLNGTRWTPCVLGVPKFRIKEFYFLESFWNLCGVNKIFVDFDPK